MDETLPDGRVAGEVFINAGKLVFVGDGIEHSLNLSMVEMARGGTANRHIYFKTPGAAISICALDAAILNEPELRATRALNTDVSSIKRKRNWLKLGIIAGLIILMSPLVVFIVFRNQVVHSIANQLPVGLETKLGRTYMKQLTLTEKLDSTGLAVEVLRQKAKLVDAQTNAQVPFQIFISHSEQVNAFALPGGYVVFNKGLLEKAKSWEEVLGVMGHEMAHVTQRHHARGVLSKIGWVTVLNIFIGDGSAITELLLSATSQLEQLSYSRGFEKESDEKGYEYLSAANINPSGLISFFETLSRESGAAGNIPELLSTHPASENRVKNLQAKLDRETNKNYIGLGDYEEFRKLIKTIDEK